MWEQADKFHGYQWWSSFGDDFKHLQKAATTVLSKAVSASVCEFNWSDVSQVITKKTNRLADSTIEKIVNTRAMYRMEKSLHRAVLLGGIPKLDDVLDEMVNEVMETTGASDDVEDAEELQADSSDDESFDVVALEDDALYDFAGPNESLEQSVLARI